jgi:predicted TIM-barrel fold metal-dependent hydrolase
MPGIRLYPNYHGYRLDDPRFMRLVELAERAALILQIAVQIEDRRTQNPMLAVSPVDLSPLPEVIRRFPNLKVVVLNSSVSTPLATRLAGAGQLYFDLSHHEGLQGISRALQSVPLARLLFGSHAPLFMMAANLFKLRESPLTDEQLTAIAFENADRLLPA